MKKVWIHKAKSYEEAQAFDDDYYRHISPAERVETIQVLREAYFRSIGGLKSEDGKRLRRVLGVVKSA